MSAMLNEDVSFCLPIPLLGTARETFWTGLCAEIGLLAAKIANGAGGTMVPVKFEFFLDIHKHVCYVSVKF